MQPSSSDPEPAERGTAAPPPANGVSETSLVRHGARFLAAGTLAFAVDATVLTLLTRGLGADPFTARLLAIAHAMIAGWLAHRRWTFAVAAPPTFREFTAYASLASGAAAFNYVVYAAILLVDPLTPPLAALLASSLLAMAVSYLGMRFGVFRGNR